MSEDLDVDDVELNDFFEPEPVETEAEASDEKTEPTVKPDDNVEPDEDKTDDVEADSSSKKDDDDTDDTKSDNASEKSGLLAALKAERQLRKDTQNEVESLRNQIPQKSDPYEPDPLDDADAWKEWNRNQVIAELEADRNKVFKDKVEESRLVAIETYGDDYEKAEEVFAILAGQNPELGVQLFESSNPAEFAYKKGMEFIKDQDAKVEARIRAEIEADTGEVTDKKSKLPNLASASGKGSNSVDVEIDNDDFNEIFGDQKY